MMAPRPGRFDGIAAAAPRQPRVWPSACSAVVAPRGASGLTASYLASTWGLLVALACRTRKCGPSYSPESSLLLAR